MKRTFCILLAITLCFASASIAFAAGQAKMTASVEKAPSDGSDNNTVVSSGNGDKVTYDGEQAGRDGSGGGNAEDGSGSGNGGNFRERAEMLRKSCITIQNRLNELKETEDELEEQYKTALKLKNKSEAQALQERLQQIKRDDKNCAEELKKARMQLREMIRAAYTQEEMAGLKELEKKLKQKYPEDRVLPVDSIIPHGFSLKLDTPPVIREGRTLVPVRAITEGMGATVTWQPESKTVLIEKEGVKIELQLESRVAFVNGQEVELEVPPGMMNDRTVVPLRFIAEQLGLKVNWDEETGSIELISPDEENVVQ